MLATGAARVRASDGWEGQSLFLNWENDAIRDSDRHYTQGARIGYFSRDDAAPKWLRGFGEWVPTWGFESHAMKWGIAAGQDIYTPESLSTRALIEDDRPYAGWLYSSFSLVRRGPGPAGIPVLETLQADLGIIGRQALGEDAQSLLHTNDPLGWDNQLDTEFGFVLGYERRYLFAFAMSSPHWRLDLIPHGNCGLGTVDIHLGLGSTIRFGYNIPNAFEVPTETPTPTHYGAYGFVGAEGRWVIRNIFLDGNTFGDSHSVDKEPLVGDLRFGLTLVLKRFELTGSYVLLSHEFEAQNTNDSHGSVSVTFKF